jgi:hypothetical protein
MRSRAICATSPFRFAMTCRRLLTIILAAVGISFLCSCSLVPEVQRAFGGHGSYWRDTHKGGKAWMEVDLRRQVATFYRGRNKMGVSAISSGPLTEITASLKNCVSSIPDPMGTWRTPAAEW